MSTEILNPSSCDKTTSGWQSCGSCSAGSETSECEATSTCDSGSNEKSGARFYGFDTPVFQDDYSALTAKFQYKLFSKTGDDSASCNTNQLVIQYSYNSGGSWTTFATISASGSHKTGTASVALTNPSTRNIANVQLRSYASATSCDPCSGGGDDEC